MNQALLEVTYILTAGVCVCVGETEREEDNVWLSFSMMSLCEDMHFSAMYHIYHISIFPVCSRLVIMSTEGCGSHSKHPMTTGTSHPSIRLLMWIFVLPLVRFCCSS